MRKPAVPDLGRLLETFFRQRLAAERGATAATITSYRDSLRLFLLFVAARRKRPPSDLVVEDLDRETILAFLDHLEKVKGNSTQTRNARLTAIRSFFIHVAYSDPALIAHAQRVLAIPTKRMHRATVGYLGRDELDAILKVPGKQSRNGRRQYALLLFLARTGARVSEAIGVNVGDLRFERPWQVRLRGKGSKERVVPLDKETTGAIQAACEERGALVPTDPVFVNARAARLTRYGARHILRSSVKKAVKMEPALLKRRVSPHTLRHTKAMHLLQSGVDLVTIQSWLGHADVTTTHQYVEADLEMKRRALEQCSTRARRPPLYRPPDRLLAFLESL